MAVLLIPNRTKDKDLAVTYQAAALLKELAIPVLLPAEFEANWQGDTVSFLPEKDAYLQADHVLTIGGDGTLLRAARHCITYQKAVLGVNLGRTGFLATCEVEELPQKLSRLAAGEYETEHRSLLAASLQQRGWTALAVNDVTIFGQQRIHPMDYTVYCDGEFVSRYRSDGIIVATPTGSTAYSLSAGGPILDAAAPVMVLTPVCAHSIQAAPLVFAATRKLEIVAEPENRESVQASADSNSQCALHPGEILQITTAPQTLPLISFDRAEQFCAIENKLTRRATP